MEPFRITSISTKGVTMNRLPVTPAEEIQVRNALLKAQDMITKNAIEEGIQEQEQRTPVLPPGYRVNCAPWHRLPGGTDTVQPGIPMEPKPVRRLGNQGAGGRAESGAEDRRGAMAVQSDQRAAERV